jgi:hypothetical protein
MELTIAGLSVVGRGPSVKPRLKKYKAQGKSDEWLRSYERGWNVAHAMFRRSKNKAAKKKV